MHLNHKSLSAIGNLLKRELTLNIQALLELSAHSIYKYTPLFKKKKRFQTRWYLSHLTFPRGINTIFSLNDTREQQMCNSYQPLCFLKQCKPPLYNPINAFKLTRKIKFCTLKLCVFIFLIPVYKLCIKTYHNIICDKFPIYLWLCRIQRVGFTSI